MDKKKRFPPSPPKGALAADPKKNQDVHPKVLRKKDAISTNNFPRNEQSRKYNIQKTKDIVKRPRTKGQYHGSPEENTKVVETKRAEHGSVLAHGSKKENHLLNGNHLLNFHYELRDTGSRDIGKSIRRYNHNSNRSLPPVQRHKYNKEQFLQASCQFVVTTNGDYCLHLTDPDILVDWILIEQIRVHSSESLSCPICLCTPVAGKMTRCGHVYCWPCILHYMHVSSKSDAWCKCPICYDSVHKSDLKSVIEVKQSTFNLGDKLSLRLMCRERGSVLATPVESVMPPSAFLSVSENSDNLIYSKLLIATVKDIINIIEFERVQLELEFKNDPDYYIQQALNELIKRKDKLVESIEPKDTLPMENIVEKEMDKQIPQNYEINNDACCKNGKFMENILEKEINKQIPQKNEINTDTSYKNDTKFLAEQSSKTMESASKNSQSASSSSKFIYFYQAEDGQHLYLHAVNVKMLEMQYGSLEHCPPLITGKLLEKESGSYTEDLRRRLRYLRHLPLTCQFELAEIELKPPLVSEEVLCVFHDQLNLRQKRRERREREERKREKKITEQQNKQMGKYLTPDINIKSHRHFPQWIPEQLFSEERISSPESTAASSVASSPSSCTLDEIATKSETELQEQQQGPSFAEMLRNTGTRAKSINAWPSVAFSVQSKTCFNTVIKSSKEDEEEEATYYSSPPLNNQCFGDALARALEQNKLLESGTNGDGNKTAGKDKKKKKKGKTTILFATGMAGGP